MGLNSHFTAFSDDGISHTVLSVIVGPPFTHYFTEGNIGRHFCQRPL